MPANRFTLAEASQSLGSPPTTIKGAAVREGIGQKFGRAWSFTAKDLERLRAAIQPGRGRPRKAPAA